MPHPINRRAFLAASLGVGVVAGGLTQSASAAATTRRVYRLDPNWGAGDPGCAPGGAASPCGGCRACVSHAENKRFATAAAADAGRAHPGCKCRVAVACAVDAATYLQLFAAGSSVDLRTPGISEQFVCSGSGPSGDPTDDGGPSPAADPVGTGSQAGLGASGGPVAGVGGAGAGGFARTGAPVARLAVSGAVGVVVGAVLLRMRRPST